MIQARDSLTTQAIQELTNDLMRLGRYHSIELPDGTILPGVQTLAQLRFRLDQFPIPIDLRGKRVLDVGAWDGWFSFEMERRGATVVAVDIAKQDAFLEARRLLNSKVEYVISDVLRLTPADIGYFDIVMFFGVLYHLKHPLLALERVCELATEMVCVESLVIDDGSNVTAQVPLMEFYEGTELAGQFDNWVGPNTSCLLALCRTAGFARVSLHSVRENRAHLTCFRKWQPLSSAGPQPEVILVENPWTRSHDFSCFRDDYITVWFRTSLTGLHCDNVLIQIGPYGSRPVNVVNIGDDRWQANCKLPPGLKPGWNPLSLSVANSPWSTPLRIPVDVSMAERKAVTQRPAADVKIIRITDGKTYEPNTIFVGVTDCSVSAWVTGLRSSDSVADISLRLDGADLPAFYVSDVDSRGVRQINAMVPIGTDVGESMISVHVGDRQSSGVSILLKKPAPNI